ncbi:hypothetical protein PHMEG_00021206 [Phytophthora megakarya]|uniref:Uncharacterized protein n=1 Tax=Phytophthora megakarya TaxID=4795 RepID=A0A225VNC9_9STRA|nr:hypothetical protein PHMEG_00021206 [Phytophthora megakarya]
MDFIFSAGVRLGIREGMVGLPDEESILMYGYTIRKREHQDISLCPLRGLHLRPGEHVNLAIRYGQCRPLQDVVCAGRGDQWVTQIVYGARSWAVAIKYAMKHTNKCSGCCSACGYGPSYKWPTKLLMRPKYPERAQVTKIVEASQPRGSIDAMGLADDTTRGGGYSPSMIGSLMPVEVSPEVVTLDVNAQGSGYVINSGSCNEVFDEMARESECDAFQDDPNIEDEDLELPSSAMPEKLLERLDAAYTRCMQERAEEFNLEPAVYIREGSEHMSQWRDQLVMLPDLDGLSPECDIEAADVGEPGESTEDQ